MLFCNILLCCWIELICTELSDSLVGLSHQVINDVNGENIQHENKARACHFSKIILYLCTLSNTSHENTGNVTSNIL